MAKRTKKSGRQRVYRSPAVITRIVKQYRAAPHGKAKAVLKKHGVSTSHIYYWEEHGF